MTEPRVTLAKPWLSFDLGEPMRVLSWTLNRPGFVEAERIVWREVRNEDLPKDLDVLQWFDGELGSRGEADSPAFLTSRAIEHYHCAEVQIGDVEAHAVATVGLSNAERVGTRQPPHPLSYGTINVAVRLNCGMSEAGLLEAMSIAVQARTSAVIDADIPVVSGRATGTGTDCVAVAAPPGDTVYAGLHTEIGEAVGRAVYDTVYAGATEWKVEQAPLLEALRHAKRGA